MDVVDDDGCVVFWKTERFTLEGMDFLRSDPKRVDKPVSAVKVMLRDRRTGKRVAAMTSHLTSGAAEADEAARVQQLVGKARQTAPFRPGFWHIRAATPLIYVYEAMHTSCKASPGGA